MESIKQLLYKLAAGQISPEETERLKEWAAGETSKKALLDRLSDPDYVATQLARRHMVAGARPMADMAVRVAKEGEPRRRKSRRAGLVAAAAALLIGCGAPLYFLRPAQPQESPLLAVEITEETDSVGISSISPGATKATLMSSTGTTFALSDADTSRVIVRTESTAAPEAVAQLCLNVPRGGEFKIILEDSTEVWLNSESKLVYPEMFGAGERRVAVVGEAYFHVNKDAARPFVVDAPGLCIKVTGTTFNVRAYPDEETVFTTLETGSISIFRPDRQGGELMLQPGHQALLKDAHIEMKVVDPKIITGWRHGRFVFEEQPLSAIMRDLSRWYDFRYEFAQPELADIVFMGSIPRYADFATAISILEKSGGIRFTTDGTKIRVEANP